MLKAKVIPWAEEGLEERLVVARPVMESRNLPAGVEVGKNTISGKRVAVRNKRYYGYRLYSAEWPKDQLHELTAPKLICVMRGTTDYIAGQHVISCDEGHFILLPALVPNIAGVRPNVKKERRREESCELLQILVSRDYVHFMFSIENSEEVQEIRELTCTVYHPQAVRLFNDFMESAQAERPRNPHLQQHFLAAFFWLLYEEIESGREVYIHFNAQQSPQAEHTVNEVRDYIKENLRHSLTIEKMAQHLYMSPRQFTRYWRRETGCSFVETLTECRLEESKRFLTDTKWTMDAIAYLVGFKSPAYFNAFFSRNEGCSPGNYRSKTLKSEP